MCEAVPCAALDAQPVLRIARRVDSDSVRVEPDTLSVDVDVRTGRCPRPRVAVDEARHAVCALEAPDVRAVSLVSTEGGRPRGTRPVADNMAHTARHAPFPKVAADLHMKTEMFERQNKTKQSIESQGVRRTIDKDIRLNHNSQARDKNRFGDGTFENVKKVRRTICEARMRNPRKKNCETLGLAQNPFSEMSR